MKVEKEVQKMAQATFSVRMDEELKRQFDSLCADFGMNATTAFNVFARAVRFRLKLYLRNRILQGTTE